MILLKRTISLYLWGYGEIGKHAGLKNQCRKASRFDSGYPYQILKSKLDNYLGYFLFVFIILIIHNI